MVGLIGSSTVVGNHFSKHVSSTGAGNAMSRLLFPTSHPCRTRFAALRRPVTPIRRGHPITPHHCAGSSHHAHSTVLVPSRPSRRPRVSNALGTNPGPGCRGRREKLQRVSVSSRRSNWPNSMLLALLCQPPDAPLLSFKGPQYAHGAARSKEYL